MNKGVLAQAEAERLLEMLKRALVREMDLPASGDEREFDVVGDRHSDVFTVSVYRGRIDGNKQNFNARIRKNNIMLLQLHLGTKLFHVNPDGERVEGSHWHIYREGYGTLWTFPAEDIRSDDFVKNTIAFLQKFNVIELPMLTQQMEM